MIVLQQPGKLQRAAIAIERNPDHDVALIRTAPLSEEDTSLSIIDRLAEKLVESGDFMTFGYPIEGPAGQVVGRVLKGHFQRYLSYTNSRGATYFAGEMSVATPAGRSGGPVVRASDFQCLEGIVTTNYDSYMVLDQIEEIDENGKVLRVDCRRIVTYGVAALATTLRPWLTDLGVLDS